MRTFVALPGAAVIPGCAISPQDAQALGPSMNAAGTFWRDGELAMLQQSQRYRAQQVQPITLYYIVTTSVMVGNSFVGSNGVTYRQVESTLIGTVGQRALFWEASIFAGKRGPEACDFSMLATGSQYQSRDPYGALRSNVKANWKSAALNVLPFKHPAAHGGL